MRKYQQIADKTALWRKLLLLCSVVFSLSFFSSNALANPANADGDASATIIQPITISKLSDLGFGRVIPTGINGTVTIDPNTGGRTSTDVSLLPNTTSAPVSVALVNVKGKIGEAFAITFDSPIIIKNGGNEMTVDVFTSDGDTNITSSGGSFISIGATLHVDAAQPVGLYSELFTITATYQ